MSRFTDAAFTWTGETIHGRAEICLLSPLAYEVDFLGSGWVIEAPAGFCCDGPSVPGWALHFLPIGRMARSAVVHDRMRRDRRRSKLLGDYVFFEAMGVEGVAMHWRLIAFPPRTWLLFAVLAAFLIFGGYCAHRGAEGVRGREAVKVAKVERKASSGRETAATTRATDTTIINAREKELSDAVSSLPDAAPSPRRVALACERLRQQGSHLPASCGPGR